MNLVLYVEDDPLLKGLLTSVRVRAIIERKALTDLVNSVNSVFLDIAMKHAPDLLRSLQDARSAKVTLTQGVPDTVGATTDPLANRTRIDDYLLKLAYRKAAQIAHPDKGGTVEDFQAVKTAFANGDTKTLFEYTTLGDKSLVDQITYWKQQVAKTAVERETAAQDFRFHIIRAYRLGQVDHAIHLTKSYLNQVIRMEHGYCS